MYDAVDEFALGHRVLFIGGRNKNCNSRAAAPGR